MTKNLLIQGGYAALPSRVTSAPHCSSACRSRSVHALWLLQYIRRGYGTFLPQGPPGLQLLLVLGALSLGQTRLVIIPLPQGTSSVPY